MALFIRQDQERSELQQRLAAELREKAKQRAAREEARPDGVEDSAYLKGTKKTTSLAWVWIVVTVLVLITLVFVAFKVSGA